jgi:trk system potassium uptake protein TrkH
MLRYRICLVHLAWILLMLATAMLLPALGAVLQGDMPQFWAFIIPMGITAFIASAILFTLRGMERDPGRAEMIVTPVLAWVITPLFAAIPFIASDPALGFTNAYFEAVSGLTTTGASIFIDLSSVPESIIFWRALLQWLGGFATLVMVMSLFAVMDIAGMQLSSNLIKHGEGESMQERITGMVRNVWGAYALLTLICMILLWLSGMPLFDGICISMSTLSTGGFMPRNGTIADYGLYGVDVILLVFMLLGCINFSLHWAFLQGRLRAYRKEPELKLLLTYIGLAALFLIVLLATGLGRGPGLPFFESFRTGLFTAVSMISTTGFLASEPGFFPLSPALLIMPLVLIGGTTASTAGGIKMMRMQILFMHSKREFSRLSHPHGVTSTFFRDRPVADDVMTSIWSFFILLILIICGLTLLLSATGLPLHSSISAVVATISNTGPSLFLMEPGTAGYAALTSAGKYILMISMLIGRLEILPLFVLLTPRFWRA